MEFKYNDISKMIDHALLKPTLTTSDLESGCKSCVGYDVASVCIMPYYVPRCAELLADSSVKVSTVIGFPLGANQTSTKVAEARQAISDGCQELDMVCNISAALSGNWELVRDDIKAVVDVTHEAGQMVKVIFENCYLEDAHRIKLCEICAEVGADWVKTSTGFGTGGATIEDLKLMRKHSPDPVQVKAAGGVRDMAKVLEVREIGVSRIGTSSTKKLLDECREMLELEPLQIEDNTEIAGY